MVLTKDILDKGTDSMLQYVSIFNTGRLARIKESSRNLFCCPVYTSALNL